MRKFYQKRSLCMLQRVIVSHTVYKKLLFGITKNNRKTYSNLLINYIEVGNVRTLTIAFLMIVGASKMNHPSGTFVEIYCFIVKVCMTILLTFRRCKVRERRQLGFVTLNGNLAVIGWVGLAYDRQLRDEKSHKDIIS